MLQELFGLTNAEAHLVQALGTGMTAIDYAHSRGISITTVYTHLRRTREKTGWKSVAELTRRFKRTQRRAARQLKAVRSGAPGFNCGD